MMVHSLTICLLAVVITFAQACSAQSSDLQATSNSSYRVEQLASGLVHPWSIAILPDNKGLLVTERPGRLRYVVDGIVHPPIDGVPEVAQGVQGGMLDITLHPNFPQNQLVYLSYSKPIGTKQTTALLIATLDLANSRLVDAKDIFIAQPPQATKHHYGGRIAFGGDGMIYCTVGDRGKPKLAQSLNAHMGKVIRIHPDGSIPKDNPFIDKGLKEIYSLGLRNPQGIIRSVNGDIWIHEHGPKGGDEINHIQSGKNYGWPIISYGVAYSGLPIGDGEHSKPGMEQPLWYWTPSIAPSGMLLYQGNSFAELSGNLLVGSLKFRLIELLVWNKDKVVRRESLIEGEMGRIRDIAETADGDILIINDEPNGGIFRLIKN